MRTALILTALLALAGCDRAVETAKQQVDNAVEQGTRAAIDEMKAQASAVIADSGLDASAVAAQVKEHGEKLKEGAKKLVGDDWSRLDAMVGQYPRDIGLYTEVSPIMPELKALLGDKLDAFRGNMVTQGPLQKDGVLYVTGNKPHQGGADAAYLLIDSKARRLEVGLVERGKLTVYASPGEPLAKPKDVRTFVSNVGSV
ncbi:hypothetical protein [Chitinolyticbacter meiyuanensis]|uniref:hypothetical protein n=1 Tax=Chitinolyticbacter meiyuanensis TaxID=682798 RepID=UPI0011E5ECEC|nr:hypothetical protein [Chitinolyticbacter meiyuanensis]